MNLNLIKRLLPALIICGISFNASGQKLAVNGKDKFTGERVKETTWFVIKEGWQTYCKGRFLNKNGKLSLELAVSRTVPIHTEDSSVVYLALAGNPPVKLSIAKQTVDMDQAKNPFGGSAARGTNYWKGRFSLPLNEEVLAELQRGSVAGVRIDTWPKPVIFEDVEAEDAAAFRRALQLAAAE